MIHHPAGLSPFRAILEKLLILHFKLLGFFTIFTPTSPPLYKSITMPSVRSLQHRYRSSSLMHALQSLSQRVSRAFSISVSSGGLCGCQHLTYIFLVALTETLLSTERTKLTERSELLYRRRELGTSLLLLHATSQFTFFSYS